MTSKYVPTLVLVGLAACQQQQPAAAPPAVVGEPAPASAAAPPAPAPATAAPAVAAASPEERSRLVQSCWSLFGAKDWAKFSGCYAEAATTEQVDMGFPTASGRSEIVEKNAKQYAAAFPDGVGEPQLTLVNGNNVATVVLFRGTNSGPLTGPAGTLPATNKKVGYLVGHVAELTEDGRAVARDRFYFDAGTMLGQLGVNPAPHRKVIEVSAAEKPVVLANNGEVETTNLALAPKGIEAFNKHDLNAVLASWTDDGVYSNQSSPADTAGKAAMKKSYGEFFKGFPDAKLEVTKSWAAGDYLVMEGTLTGTNTGDMPSMKLKKTGKKVSLRYLEIAKVQNGKLKNSWVFTNGMAFATQLGLVPPPSSKDPKVQKDGKAPAAAPASTPPAMAGAKPAAPATPATPPTPAKDGKAAKPAAPAVPATPAAAKSGSPATPATPAAPAGSAKK